MKNLIEALIKSQLDFPDLVRDATNPHYKSEYLTLDKTVKLLTPILAKNGLTVIQHFDADEHGDYLVTILAHSSGESITGKCRLVSTQATPQAIMSASTYARRYGLLAIVGASPTDDDDGQVAITPAPRKMDNSDKVQLLVKELKWEKETVKKYMVEAFKKDEWKKLTHGEQIVMINDLTNKTKDIAI